MMPVDQEDSRDFGDLKVMAKEVENLDSYKDLISHGVRLKVLEPIGVKTTYRVGGKCILMVEPHSEEDLFLVDEFLRESELQPFVLGAGSNTLVSDNGFKGVVISLGAPFSYVDFSEPELIKSGGATPLPVLARKSSAAGWTGLEWAVGVPGTCGGAISTNAGGHGATTLDTLIEANIFDFEEHSSSRFMADELRLGYRSSALTNSQVITQVIHRVSIGDPRESANLISEIVKWRRANQPGGQNAGSVFVNPLGDSAGRLIEECNLKGFRLGGAQVSTKHANFIQADPRGSANDVFSLIEFVKERVLIKFGIELQPELRLLGFRGN
ncbi:MAG: UDP-N-acetylmuramate dehydrogenase [Acidimicrobiales bacterium]|nr:UDP-N-acetylmuramate dehydrogenase [Acidimicrobiales bacterium]